MTESQCAKVATEEMNPACISEIRGVKMISPKTKEVAFRSARFLQPLAENVNQAAGIPHIPLLCDVFPHNLEQCPSKVIFKGWKSPQKDWSRWVQVLAMKHKRTWERSGIYDAILCSTYEVRCNVDVVLGLVEFWCPETNTFLFPWGEATITLEDMMVLGGYPVSGKPVRRPPTGNLVKLVEEMERKRREFCRSKSKKASHGEWLKHFLGSNDEFEHVAFLSLWLSRYVFPQLPDTIVGKHVFAIAAYLALGTPMALAPAVLASLYRDLTFLKKEAISFSELIAVAAPFQLLQLWAFERFPSLGPKTPNSLMWPGEPRAARWSKLNSRINLQLVKSTVRLKENFLWRPYAANLKNWQQLSFHKETKEFLIDCSSSHDKELRSFAQCLQPTELVGIDCKETYQPQRVAMQFGFDQDIPGRNPHRFSTVNLEYSNISICIPARSFEPGVSARYLRWWEDSMSARANAIKEIVARKGSSMNYHKTSSSAKPTSCSENCRNAKQVAPKRDSKGGPSALSHRKLAQPYVITTERNDETDQLPISMLARTRPTMEDISITSKEAANSRHKYPPSSDAGLTQKKQIHGSPYDHGHNVNRGKPMKPHSSYPKNTTTQFKSSCHSSKDVFPSETWSSNTIRKRKLSPTNNTECNLHKAAFPLGLQQNGSSVCTQDGASGELKASENTSDDALDFLLLSQRIKLTRISREQQKIFPVKAEAVEKGDSQVNTSMLSPGTHGFHMSKFEEKLQKMEKLLSRLK